MADYWDRRKRNAYAGAGAGAVGGAVGGAKLMRKMGGKGALVGSAGMAGAGAGSTAGLVVGAKATRRKADKSRNRSAVKKNDPFGISKADKSKKKDIATSAAGAGAGTAGVFAAQGGTRGVKSMNRTIRAVRSNSHMPGMTMPRRTAGAARTMAGLGGAAGGMRRNAGFIGAGIAAGGAAGALAPEKKKVKKMHSVSAFGVNHGDEVEKAFSPRAALANSGKRLKIGASQKMNELNQMNPGGAPTKGFLKAKKQYNRGAARQKRFGG